MFTMITYTSCYYFMLMWLLLLKVTLTNVATSLFMSLCNLCVQSITNVLVMCSACAFRQVTIADVHSHHVATLITTLDCKFFVAV